DIHIEQPVERGRRKRKATEEHARIQRRAERPDEERLVVLPEAVDPVAYEERPERNQQMTDEQEETEAIVLYAVGTIGIDEDVVEPEQAEHKHCTGNARGSLPVASLADQRRGGEQADTENADERQAQIIDFGDDEDGEAEAGEDGEREARKCRNGGL